MDLRRNAPCPCGSGKKYKKCCGAKSDNVLELNHRQLSREIEDVLDRLLRFADTKYSKFLSGGFLGIPGMPFPEEVAGWDAPGGPADLVQNDDADEAPGGVAVSLLLECMIFDVRLPHGKTVLQEFLRKHRAGLKTIVLRSVEQWVDSHISVYEVTAHYPDECTMLVKEVFPRDELTVKYPEEDAPVQVVAGDLLVMRLVPVGAFHEYTAAFFVLSGVLRGLFLERLDAERAGGRTAGRGAQDWPSFLKSFGWMVVLLASEFIGREPVLSTGLDEVQLHMEKQGESAESLNLHAQGRRGEPAGAGRRSGKGRRRQPIDRVGPAGKAPYRAKRVRRGGQCFSGSLPAGRQPCFREQSGHCLFQKRGNGKVSGSPGARFPIRRAFKPVWPQSGGPSTGGFGAGGRGARPAPGGRKGIRGRPGRTAAGRGGAAFLEGVHGHDFAGGRVLE